MGTAAVSRLPNDEQDPIVALFSQPESRILEFKSSARWDYRQAQLNRDLTDVIVKSVAAMLNSDGGDLVIGVDDSGHVLGLQPDYGTLGNRGDRDGYELFLTDTLGPKFGLDVFAHLQVTFPLAEGKELCRIEIAPSPRPVYVEESGERRLYIRAGNSTRAIRSIPEAVNYVSTRWNSGSVSA